MPKKIVRKKVPTKARMKRKKDMAKTLKKVSKYGTSSPGYEKGVLVVRRNDKGMPKTELKKFGVAAKGTRGLKKNTRRKKKK
jgi:hypothetical protein